MTAHVVLLQLLAASILGIMNGIVVDALQLGLGNTDWVLSDKGDTCDNACSLVQGGTCNVEGMNELNSVRRMRFVDSLFGGHECEDFDSGYVFGNEPSFYRHDGTVHCVHLNPGEESTCDQSLGDEQRYCCCGENCPVKSDIGWVVSGHGESCTEACETVELGYCNLEGTSSMDSLEAAEYVYSSLFIECDEYVEDYVFGNEPSTYTSNGVRYCLYLPTGQTTNCDEYFSDEERICCCSDNCDISENM